MIALRLCLISHRQYLNNDVGRRRWAITPPERVQAPHCIMPAKPETGLYRRINAGIPKVVHRQKITSLFGNGTPDFWYSGFKADAWVEYKWVPNLSRNGVDPLKLLSPLQAHWINCRYAEGRLIFVIIGSPAGCAILDSGRWNHRVAKEEFRYSPPEISALLLDYLHACISAVSDESSISYKSDVQNHGHVSADSGDGV